MPFCTSIGSASEIVPSSRVRSPDWRHTVSSAPCASSSSASERSDNNARQRAGNSATSSRPHHVKKRGSGVLA